MSSSAGEPTTVGVAPPWGVMPVVAPPWGVMPVAAPPWGVMPVVAATGGIMPVAAPPWGAVPVVAATGGAPAGVVLAAGGAAAGVVPVAGGAPAGAVVPALGGACPAAMVLVEGAFCPSVQHECVEWLEDPAKFSFARCARYREPATCTAPERVPMRFCIDRDEYVAPGDELPLGDVSWTEAKGTCERAGKRLCAEREWVFACEGEAMRPYPSGFERDANACNFDHTTLLTPDGKLRDHRAQPASKPACLSPFGGRNMVGNIDEWVVLDKPHVSAKNGNRRMMSGLKGGWWGPLRNRCRPVTVDHDEHFHELQTGFRCCAEASGGAVVEGGRGDAGAVRGAVAEGGGATRAR